MEILHEYIDSLAPNAAAIKNGKALAKGKYQKLCVSEDDTVIFGECVGSGKKPYICSVDFVDKDNPIGRCSCPSRQIPCKHALGLMYAYADGLTFVTEEIPEDIISKREKLGKRAENKEKKVQETKEKLKNGKTAPTKAKQNAAVKKLGQQLEGIELADKLLKNILQMGLAGIDQATMKVLETQVKQLDSYYIGGIQSSFKEILINVRVSQKNKDDNFDKPISSLLYMSSLLKRARVYLTEKMENPETAFELDITSELEEQIGHAWKLEELMAHQKYIENARLLQLAFYSYDDESRQELVDEGYYLCLDNQEIYKTVNYRPYKALKYIKEDDSVFGIVEAPELYIYPGGLNPRVRWERYSLKDLEKDVLKQVVSASKDNYKDLLKIIKNQIKNPMSDKNPLALIQIDDVITTESEGEIHLEVLDKAGTRLLLKDEGYIKYRTAGTMRHINKELLRGSALLVMFENNTATGLLAAKPLSVITENEIVRLLF